MSSKAFNFSYSSKYVVIFNCGVNCTITVIAGNVEHIYSLSGVYSNHLSIYLLDYLYSCFISFERPYIMNTSLYFPSDLCLHILSPHLGLVFSLFSLDCQRAEVNHFDESQLISIFFCVSCFWCQS